MYNPKTLGSMNPRPGVKSLAGSQSQNRAVMQPRQVTRSMPGTPPVGRQHASQSQHVTSASYQSHGSGGTVESFCGMIRNMVSSFALIDDDVYQKNISMAHGNGMSDKDRAVSLECADYLMSNMAFIFMGLVLDQKFKTSFIEAVSVEIYYDQANEEEKKNIRASVMNPNVYKSPYSMMVIGMTTFMPKISVDLMQKMNAGFKALDSYSKEFDDEVAKLSPNQKAEYGFVFSNFMYLIRAFMNNDAFMGYVMTVLDKVKAIISKP